MSLVPKYSVDADVHAGTFAEIATALHRAGGVTETVDMVVRFALTAVDCTHAGVVFAVGGRRPRSPRSPSPA